MSTPLAIPPQGLAVAVRQNAASPSGVGIVAVKRNNLNPRLTLFPDRLVYNILADNELRLDQLDAVDVLRALGGYAVRVRARDATFDYTGIVASATELKKLLDHLDGRAPLTERAQQFRVDGALPPAVRTPLQKAGLAMVVTGAFNFLFMGTFVMAVLGGGAFALSGSELGWLCGAPGLLLWPLGLAEIVAGVLGLRGSGGALRVMSRAQLLGVLGLSAPSVVCSFYARRMLALAQSDPAALEVG
ncbi:MAG: hypothetical protein H6739_21235 [Alphaproteobacteria bacterium]|nr:hypothetical protein [Alphaproteobacteria bacterium]